MKLEYVSARGDVFTLTANNFVYLVDVDGQTTGTASISSVTIGGIDGDTVNNMQAQPRTIVLTLRVKSGVNVEEAKREILKVVKLKQTGSLVWEQDNRTVRIDGRVEAVDMPRWNNTVAMQITLHCEQPFWEDIDFIVREINEALDLHYFTTYEGDMLYFTEEGRPLGEYDVIRTKEFRNNGDVSVGMEIEILAFEPVTNPIIYDIDGNFFGVGYGTDEKKVTMQVGDIIRINSNKGKKSVTMNGSSLLEKIKPKSTWLQLAAGDNIFSVNSDDDSTTNMSFNLSYKQRYI